MKDHIVGRLTTAEVANMEVDKVADMVVNMEMDKMADIVADIGVDKVVATW